MNCINKLKAIAAFFVMITWLLNAATTYAEDGALISIEELHYDAPDYWDGEFEAHGRKISFHAPVYVPDVKSAPVLVVSGCPIQDDINRMGLPDDMVIVVYEPSYQAIRKKAGLSEGYPQNKFFDFPWSIEGREQAENAYAENADVSISEAMKDMQNIVDQVFGPDQFGVFVDRCEMLSPVRQNEKDVDFSGKAGWESYSGKGSYGLDVHLMEEGIPIFMGIGCSYRSPGNYTYSMLAWRSSMQVSLYFRPDQYLAISFDSLFEKKSTYIDDIPLCSFDQITEEIERFIFAGNIRNVYSIKLGYVVYQIPNRSYDFDKLNQDMVQAEYLAVPTWIVECTYVKNAKSEVTTNPKSNVDDENERPIPYYGKYGFQYLTINAQTGQANDPYETESSKSEYLKKLKAPQIIEW